MEVETSTNETIPEPQESPEKMEVTSPVEEATEESDQKEVESTKKDETPKKNGTIEAPVKETKPVKPQMTGVIVQFPEIFSLKRDYEFIDAFEEADDIKMQKIAYIECESEEAAGELQSKLNGTTMNSKKLSATRLDLNEKNGLYISGLKKDVTEEMLKEMFPGIQKLLREKYNTYILFSCETECRAAKTKILKDGINGQRLHCEFDVRGKDRFRTEEPPAKKLKEDAEKPKESKDEAEGSKEEATEEETPAEVDEANEEEAATEEQAEDEASKEEVKADEW